MKRGLLLLICIWGVHQAMAAQVHLIFLQQDWDDVSVREAVKEVAEDEDRRDFQQWMSGNVAVLSKPQIESVCGPALRTLPKDGALPIFADQTISVVASLNQSPPSDRFSYFRMGDVGYLQVVERANGDGIVAMACYFKVDAHFVPLKDLRNLDARREWDRKQWALVREWCATNFPQP
jgi:hypothetical protein